MSAEIDSPDAITHVEAAIERAESGCLVGMALRIPVNLKATVRVAGDASLLQAAPSVG